MNKVILLLLLFCAGCSTVRQLPPATAPAQEAVNLDLPAGYTVEKLPHQFEGPTQFTIQDDVLFVAQLNGGENDGQGQIVRVDLADGSRRVLVAGLDKPTGLVVQDNVLWIATRDAILRMYLDREGTPELETILADLPTNGRSNGTLTLTSRGIILYETSGNRRDAASGKLWELDPESLDTEMVASGLKGAYAHAEDANGRIWLTEIADGQIDGETLPDELNLLLPGADFGWPRCYGRELAGPDCDGVRPAVALFPPHSTPTSVAVSPFAPDTLLVALWLTGEVVQVPVTFSNGNASGEPAPFLSGLDRPQHLLARPDGSLWVSDFAGGHIYRISQQ